MKNNTAKPSSEEITLSKIGTPIKAVNALEDGHGPG